MIDSTIENIYIGFSLADVSDNNIIGDGIIVLVIKYLLLPSLLKQKGDRMVCAQTMFNDNFSSILLADFEVTLILDWLSASANIRKSMSANRQNLISVHHQMQRLYFVLKSSECYIITTGCALSDYITLLRFLKQCSSNFHLNNNLLLLFHPS